MSPPILATKLYLPPLRPSVVPRPRLIKRLNEGLHRKLTLISAPAGFGKTTLISEWVASCGRPVAWLSLDERDSDLPRFLTYLVAALQTLAPNRAEERATQGPAAGHIGAGALAALQAPQLPPVESILTTLLNELVALTGQFILVLDDYHLVDARPVDQALAFLVERLPRQLHLVIATREDPDLPLARLRARDQLTELRVNDLRFALAEAAGFLQQTMGLPLSAAEIAALEARTEGWIAGLQLAALALQGAGATPGLPDTSGFVRSFAGSHHFVMDYLVEEVLQQQPDAVQAFLLSTSILERLCGPLCDAVLPTAPAAGHRSDGQETLEHLERANLLIVPLDDRRQWYRYHHLFADVLQARLLKERPDQVAALHRRAAAWYAQNNFRPDAIRHALVAGEFDWAADLIERERSENLGRYFQSPTWLGWVRALPEDLVRSRPRLALGLAWELLFLGELEAAGDRLEDAERLLAPGGAGDPANPGARPPAASDDEETGLLRASSAIARAFQAQALGDVAGTVRHARRALALIPEADHYRRGLARSMLGAACLSSGDLEMAHAYIAEAMGSLRLAGNLLFATSGTFGLADIRAVQGRLGDAIRTYEQALQRVTAAGEPMLPGTADLHLGLSELYYERGDAAAAAQHLLRAEELGQPAALDDWPYRLYLVRSRVMADKGDLDSALALLDEAERLLYRSPIPDLRPVPALKARILIRQGRLAEAQGWARRQALAVDDELSFLREFEHITLARLLIAAYRQEGSSRSLEEATALLARLRSAAEEGGRMGRVIEILLLQALAHQAQRDNVAALPPLNRALALAEPEGFVRQFVDEGAPLAELLTRLLTSGAGSEALAAYVRQLLANFDRPDGAQPLGLLEARPASPAPQSLIEPLSPRELEVLQLIAEGLSNHEIGERLFLALNTVKGHNRKIFDKLQVQRRTEAVARARELGLL